MKKNKNIEIRHINNKSSAEVCSALLKYDSIHGKFNADINFDDKHLIINKSKISFSQEANLDNINWKKHDVDYVFECTGKFNSKDKLEAHLENGAKKVIVSAPCKNADRTIVYGVNESELQKMIGLFLLHHAQLIVLHLLLTYCIKTLKLKKLL